MSVFIFPGQGAQFKGMGKALFNQFPQMVDRANELLGYDLNIMVDSEEIHQTHVTQPLIYCISCLSWLELKEKFTAEVVLGHSLGEYAALFAAEVLDFETGLKIVMKRGALMQSIHGGAMAAIIGITADEVENIINQNQLNVYIANYNAPQQTVISGHKQAIEDSRISFAKTKFIPLTVSGAFHSPLMETVKDEFRRFLESHSFNPAKLPIILNSTARGYVDCNQSWPEILSRQLVSPVYWLQSIQYCLSLGLLDFVEVEPGQLLTGLINKIV